MKQKLFPLIFGLVVCGGFLNAQTLDEAILRAALRIGSDLPANATVALIHFRSDTETLTAYVMNELHGALLRNRRVTPVKPDEGQLQKIRDELRFNEAGEIDEESARSIGQLLGARYLVSGSMERGASGYELLVTAVDAESAEQKSQYSASVNPNDVTQMMPELAQSLAEQEKEEARIRREQDREQARADPWRNKWIYLGGMLGGGPYEYIYYDYDENGHYNDRDNIEASSGLFAFGLVSEFALLPFFSIEVDLGFGFGGGRFLVMPILAKIGYRFTRVELAFDIGYTIGLGFTLGGTFGFKAGPGVLFLKMLGTISPDSDTVTSSMAWFVGYKVGLIDKKQKGTQAPQANASSDKETQELQADTSDDEETQEP